MKLEDYTEISARCSQCNFCQAACPAFRANGTENWLARNRLNLIRSVLIERTMDDTPRFREMLDTCLLCTGCTQSCPSMVPVDEIIISARCRVGESGIGFSSLKKKFISGVMASTSAMSFIGKAGALAQKFGLAPDKIPKLTSTPFFSRQSGTLSPDGQAEERILYYAGCGTNLIYPETGEALTSLLLKSGREVIIPEGLTCCGVPLLAEGDIEGAAAVFRKNIDTLSSVHCDRIIMDCTSCMMMFMKKGIKLFEPDDPIRDRITTLNSKTENALSYIGRISQEKKGNKPSLSFTYHAPCHTDKSKSGWSITPEILSKLTGGEYRPMDEPELCCGAGGTYYMRGGGLSEKLLKIKVDDIRRTGASAVVTECPMCRFYISRGLADIEVLHPLEYLKKNS